MGNVSVLFNYRLLTYPDGVGVSCIFLIFFLKVYVSTQFGPISRGSVKMSELWSAKSYVFDTKTGWIIDPQKNKKVFNMEKKKCYLFWLTST